MRAIKTSIISILAIGLLAGSAVGVAAQDEDSMVPSTFTAKGEFVGRGTAGDPQFVDGAMHVRGDFTLDVDSTDPRVTGTYTYVWNEAVYPGATLSAATVHTGTVIIENEGGSWAGTFTGFRDEADADTYLAQLAGQDGYEGWTMLLDGFCACVTGALNEPTLMQGVILRGDLPAPE